MPSLFSLEELLKVMMSNTGFTTMAYISACGKTPSFPGLMHAEPPPPRLAGRPSQFDDVKLESETRANPPSFPLAHNGFHSHPFPSIFACRTEERFLLLLLSARL